MKTDILVILDPGHGGLKNGAYVTAPAKMYAHKNGPTIYEGVFNRDIAAKLEYKLKTLGIPSLNVARGPEDKPLKDRVEEANKAAALNNGKAIYISIHANAGGGKGFECYTSKGETLSDKIADFYMEAMEEEFPKRVARMDTTDGDKDKEANFYVLKKTSMPAILTESFFMDNLEDAKEMLTTAGASKVANAHLKTILNVLEIEDFFSKKVGAKKPAKKKVKK
tara:strand:- start:351 stop:1019 length:669 start_codon:yes stop_codon:yes gene_type:complete